MIKIKWSFSQSFILKSQAKQLQCNRDLNIELCSWTSKLDFQQGLGDGFMAES